MPTRHLSHRPSAVALHASRVIRSCLGLFLVLAGGCSGSDRASLDADAGPLFGGLGVAPGTDARAREPVGDDAQVAAIDARPDVGAANGGASGSSLPRCRGVAPGAQNLVDDFEDGDGAIRVAPQRIGFWFITHDDTPGVVTPIANFVPELGGANGTDYAAHVVASGFNAWGMMLSTTLLTDTASVHCPYNASQTRGIGLWLKGTGRVRIGVGTAGTVSTEFGGACEPTLETCWDGFRKLVPLPAEWTYREIAWSAMTQTGWGKSVPFEADAIMAIEIVALPSDLPVDFWVDEITLLPSDDSSGVSSRAADD